jgi:hypothetical protein
MDRYTKENLAFMLKLKIDASKILASKMKK